MFAIVAIGIGLTAATVMIHGLATVFWIQFMRARYSKVTGQSSNTSKQSDDVHSESTAFSSSKVIWVLCYTTVMLAILHFAEVALWAFAYLNIPGLETPGDIEEAFYFSMVTFTSLGYGDVVISNSWRILSGIEAMSGMLVFGWSSALLLTALIRMLGGPLSQQR